MRRLTPALVGGLLAAMPAAAVAAPERAFELVTPAAKGGSDVSYGFFATPDGNAVGFESFAVLGDPDHGLYSIPYVARRAEDGWKTTSMQPSIAEQNPTLLNAGFTSGLSADLSAAFSAGYGAFTADDQNDAQDIARVRDGVSTWVTPSLTLPDQNMYMDSDVVGSSQDGRHFVVSTAKPTLPGVVGGTQLYLHGPDGVTLASRLPNGDVPGGARLGNGRGFQKDNRAISADGRTLFFTTTTGPAQLYMRRDGATTLISADTSGNPGTAAAAYQAATEDGSKVLFSSTSQLTADAPVGGGLYRYDVETDQLQLMVAGAITAVMQAADDFSRVYVVSNAQLEPGTGIVNRPKIYLISDAPPRFVADLNTQDNPGWIQGAGLNVGGVSADGRYLVFQSRTILAGANLGPAKSAVYRYDADSNAIACLSCRPDGSLLVNGASLVNTIAQGDNPSRVVTDDGRLAVFETVDALLPEDRNELSDVYGYDDDGLHLISGGTPDDEAHGIDITPDGSDVFFVTTASLAADDVDHGYSDVYTARIGGGFPPVEEPCSVSTCDRPDAPATTFTPVIGSTGVFDAAGPPSATPKVGFKVGRISAASRRSWARTGRTTLKVRVTSGAKITARTKLAGKTVSTARATRSIAGTATLTLKLSKSAKARLQRKGRLKLTVAVAVSGADKASKATVTLIKPKTKKKTGR